MLQKEFETRTGLQVTPAEYVTIERMYYACDNMDKDEFCKLWLENHKKPNGLVTGLFAHVQEQDRNYKSLEQACNNLQNQLKSEKEAHQKFVSDMADWLLKASYETDDEGLRDKAVELLGEKQYIIRKLQMGMEPSAEDRDLILSMLTSNK